MGWLGNACKCKCGWVCDQTNEEDTERKCSKCGTIYDKRSYGWCQRTEDKNEKDVKK